MNTIKINKQKTLMVAHRGLSGIELENTNSAFIAAGNRSYYGIETDVHRTLDGKYVVFHDDETGRLCDINISVEGSTFDALRNLSLNARDGEKNRADMRIPTLKEYIRTCKRYEKVAVLELKNEFPMEDIENICKEILEEAYLDQVIFISFCFVNLVRLRKLYPEQTVQFLLGQYDEAAIKDIIEHKMDLDIYYKELTKERLEYLHSKGIKVNCWTCDDTVNAEALAEYGIEFITTNILE